MDYKDVEKMMKVLKSIDTKLGIICAKLAPEDNVYQKQNNADEFMLKLKGSDQITLTEAILYCLDKQEIIYDSISLPNRLINLEKVKYNDRIWHNGLTSCSAGDTVTIGNNVVIIV